MEGLFKGHVSLPRTSASAWTSGSGHKRALTDPDDDDDKPLNLPWRPTAAPLASTKESKGSDEDDDVPLPISQKSRRRRPGTNGHELTQPSATQDSRNTLHRPVGQFSMEEFMAELRREKAKASVGAAAAEQQIKKSKPTAVSKPQAAAVVNEDEGKDRPSADQQKEQEHQSLVKMLRANLEKAKAEVKEAKEKQAEAQQALDEALRSKPQQSDAVHSWHLTYTQAELGMQVDPSWPVGATCGVGTDEAVFMLKQILLFSHSDVLRNAWAEASTTYAGITVSALKTKCVCSLESKPQESWGKRNRLLLVLHTQVLHNTPAPVVQTALQHLAEAFQRFHMALGGNLEQNHWDQVMRATTICSVQGGGCTYPYRPQAIRSTPNEKKHLDSNDLTCLRKLAWDSLLLPRGSPSLLGLNPKLTSTMCRYSRDRIEISTNYAKHNPARNMLNIFMYGFCLWYAKYYCNSLHTAPERTQYIDLLLIRAGARVEHNGVYAH